MTCRSAIGSKSGFSLVELLVVILLMGMLAGLLLPAIQAAREASRKTSCANNLKQIGVALQNHVDQNGNFPIGARSQVTFGISWWVPILPHLEETAVFERFDLKGAHNGSAILNPTNGQLVNGLLISVMACPSSLIPTLGPAGSYKITMPSYVGISGSTDDAGFPEKRINTCCLPENKGEISAGGVLIPNRAVRLAEISDGLSNTLIVGECSDYAFGALGNTFRIDGGFPNGWITGTTAIGTPPNYHWSSFAPPSWNVTTIRYPINTRNYNQPGIDDDRGANNPLVSAHPGGVYGLFGDGSVRFLADETDLLALKQLATRDDGLVAEPIH